jgi:hypothetical protein
MAQMAYRQAELLDNLNQRSGPCEDDYEVKCPYIGMLPEETHAEEPSPLDFSWQKYQGRR